jgi:hypothetical protein
VALVGGRISGSFLDVDALRPQARVLEEDALLGVPTRRPGRRRVFVARRRDRAEEHGVGVVVAGRSRGFGHGTPLAVRALPLAAMRAADVGAAAERDFRRRGAGEVRDRAQWRPTRNRLRGGVAGHEELFLHRIRRGNVFERRDRGVEDGGQRRERRRKGEGCAEYVVCVEDLARGVVRRR